MSEQKPKLTTKEQLQRNLAETERALEESHRDVEWSNRKLEESNKKLAEAKEELNTYIHNFLDINKISFETMKHLTTLSVGSILLMITFIEKLFNTNRGWRGLIGTTLIFFVVSIICAVSSMTRWALIMTLLITSDVSSARTHALKQIKIERAAFLTFILGIACLVVFALKNLY